MRISEKKLRELRTLEGWAQRYARKYDKTAPVVKAIETRDITGLCLRERRAVVRHEMMQRGIPLIWAGFFLPSEYLPKLGYRGKTR